MSNRNFKPIRYDSPIKKDMAILIPFFNPVGSKKLVENLGKILDTLRVAAIPTFVGEIVFEPDVKSGQCQQEHRGSVTVETFKSNSYMFYKENILRIMICNLPTNFTKVCSLDADILFGDPAWYDKLSSALNSYTCVQPFYKAYLLNKKNIWVDAIQSSLSGGVHPGYAFAAQRSFFQEWPLFDYALIGGGDNILFSFIMDTKKKIESPYALDVQEWERPVNSRVSYLDMKIYHLYHGTIENRQYSERKVTLAQQLQSLGIEKISEATERRGDGILEWKPEFRQTLNSVLQTYFSNRKDDD